MALEHGKTPGPPQTPLGPHCSRCQQPTTPRGLAVMELPERRARCRGWNSWRLRPRPGPASGGLQSAARPAPQPAPRCACRAALWAQKCEFSASQLCARTPQQRCPGRSGRRLRSRPILSSAGVQMRRCTSSAPIAERVLHANLHDRGLHGLGLEKKTKLARVRGRKNAWEACGCLRNLCG